MTAVGPGPEVLLDIDDVVVTIATDEGTAWILDHAALRIRRGEVVGVVGASHKIETARGFGADAVIDKSTQDLWAEARRQAPDRYDVIFDANGVETLKDSLRHLGSPGKLVIYGFHTMLSRGRDRPNWWKLLRAWWKTLRFDPLRLTVEVTENGLIEDLSAAGTLLAQLRDGGLTLGPAVPI